MYKTKTKTHSHVTLMRKRKIQGKHLICKQTDVLTHVK